MRILVADDQHTLVRNIQRYLQLEEQYTVDAVFTGEDAIHKALASAYDCIVLDVLLPNMNGFEVCSTLRKEGCIAPILMLTSLSESKHAIQGLNMGADDYLTKPFNMEELCARIHALLRRKTSDRSPILHCGDITVDPNTKSVKRKGKAIQLSPKEYALLEYLMRNAGVVHSREDIIEHVWGETESTLFSQTLDVHIAYLRKKVGKKTIHTVTGAGYMIPDDTC